MKPLEQQLSELKEQLAGHFDNAAKEQKALGTVLEKTQSKITALQAQADAIDARLAERKAAEVPQPGVLEVLQANDSVNRLMKDRSGRAVITLEGKHVRELLGRKTTITSSAVGVATTGVLQIDRIPGITLEPRQTLTVRDLLSARPTTTSSDAWSSSCATSGSGRGHPRLSQVVAGGFRGPSRGICALSR